MLFSEIDFKDEAAIQAYGKNFFRIKGEIKNGGIFIFSKFVREWKGFNDLSPLQQDLSTMELLFIGSGNEQKEIDEKFKEYLTDNSLNFEVYSTPVACSAYNIMISEFHKVGALLLPVTDN